jgi:hypothetical protein
MEMCPLVLTRAEGYWLSMLDSRTECSAREECYEMARQKREEQPQEPVEVERLSRRECAARVVKAYLSSHENGDVELSELADRADKLFVAGRDGDQDYSDPDRASGDVQVVLEQLEAVELVVMEWHCVIHPVKRPNGNGK